jgi:hypothetical protein
MRLPILFSLLLISASCKQETGEKEIEKSFEENPIEEKIIYHYNGEDKFSSKQVAAFTNFRDMNSNETFIKLYDLPLCPLFTSYEDNYDNKKILYLTFMMEEWRDGPKRSTLYRFPLDEGYRIISIFQIPNDEKIVCLMVDEKTGSSKPLLFARYCGNSSCYMEKSSFTDLKKYDKVKNYGEFLQIYKAYK